MVGAASSSSSKLIPTTGVRIVVAGDRGTGKSSLIFTASADFFPTNVRPVLPPSWLPVDMFPDDRVPVTVIDTCSSLENRGKLDDELKRADVVVLTYACDQPSSLDQLTTFWLPELRRLNVRVPVIVSGCKLDLMHEKQKAISLEQVMSPILQQFPEIETCLECSAYKHIQIPEVFFYAQKAAIHPTAPLFDKEAKTLKPRCVEALERIFDICDHDIDGALSDAELNDFQVKCFGYPLQPSEVVGVKRVVQEKLPEGVNENGLTLSGFLFLHTLFIETGLVEKTWTVLRKFGYNNDIRLVDDDDDDDDDQLLPPIKRTPHQLVLMTVTSEAVEFLKGVFTYNVYQISNNGYLISNNGYQFLILPLSYLKCPPFHFGLSYFKCLIDISTNQKRLFWRVKIFDWWRMKLVKFLKTFCKK
ncbi:mitochondrial Rho GTPase 1-like [Rutidosis leptorrhynchoides]|uniref:mitochondrial Rho GTPase 1-like n=1 Tax=Rutidosis leptorrhynchoides TaxID=125765 RepID=UPI003A990228